MESLLPLKHDQSHPLNLYLQRIKALCIEKKSYNKAELGIGSVAVYK